MLKNCKKPASLSYYYGRISREEAEKRLSSHLRNEGTYLLRANMTISGNFVLSIICREKVHHYSLESQPDGTIMIQEGKPFPGPHELIEYHKKNLDGLLTKPTKPCNRDPGTSPMAWPYVSMLVFEKAIKHEAERYHGAVRELMCGPQRDELAAKVAKKLHTVQPWFHEAIDREEAERRMFNSGHQDGKFLVRVKNNDGGGFALTLSYQSQTKHYRIDRKDRDKYGIEDGPTFSCLMDLIAHYFNRMDGLLCKLTMPCVRLDYRGPRHYDESGRNPLYNPYIERSISAAWEEPDGPDLPQRYNEVPVEDHQKIYDFNFNEELLSIPIENLKLTEELGKGYFGSVMKGRLNLKNNIIPVAVKTLIQNDVPNGQSEIMQEAKLMARLRHTNVIRMIGICRTSTLMLVLELAPLGQLNKYIRKRSPKMPVQYLIEILRQVAVGMAYLGQQNFVHRDLAARNVLLVTETFAKISDFGMSKALGIGENYYKTERAGKWPLKWYAPECIWFYKFDSKSDVWSYGVTMWETFENGEKPYRGMKGQDILEFIENGQRLAQPSKCSRRLYDLMLSCWAREPEDRPSFQEIVDFYKEYPLNK